MRLQEKSFIPLLCGSVHQKFESPVFQQFSEVVQKGPQELYVKIKIFSYQQRPKFGCTNYPVYHKKL